MSNMRITWPNRFGGITPKAFASDYWVSSLPPSNLATKQIAQVARSAGVSGASLLLDAGSAVEVGVFAAVGHNLTTTADIRVRAYTADPRGSYWWDFGPSGPTAAATIYGGEGSGGTGYPGTYWGADGLLKISSGGGRYTHTFGTGGACLGLLLEPERTNYVIWSRDGSNAAWTKTNITAALSAIGIDGGMTATRLTATAAPGQIKQLCTLSSATRRFSFYARRVTGTSTFSYTLNNFSSITGVTLTTEWQRFDVTCTIGNPEIGFQIASSGDVVDIDCVQLETGNFPSTPIITAGATLTRLQDSFSGSVASNSAGTMLVRAKCLNAPAATEDLVGQGTMSTGGTGRGFAMASGSLQFVGVNSSSTQWALGSTAATSAHVTMCGSYAANDIACSVNGAAVSTDTTATVAALSTAIVTPSAARVGVYVISVVAWFSTAETDANVQSLASDFSRGTPDYDSTAIDAWPAAWVSGTTAEQRAGVVGCSIIAPVTPQTYRYWRVDLIDAANPDGYIEVGRLFAGSPWSPTYNVEYGASLGYEDRDQINEMDSGSEYMRKRPAPRIASFTLQALSDSESVSTVIDMQRRLGSSGEVLYEWDPTDTIFAPTRRFLGRLRRADPLTAAFLQMNLAQVEVKELL